jgi:patatin-like phospholipase/acyl hydrolase
VSTADPTDIKGHKISIYYSLTKSFSIGGNMLIYEALERSNQNEVKLYQADLSYKF